MGTLYGMLVAAWIIREIVIDRRYRSGVAGETRDAGTKRRLHLTIYACLALAIGWSIYSPFHWPAAWRAPLFRCGLVLMVLGLALRWWSVLTLDRFFTVDVAMRPDHRLVRTGPYHWLRHPSYTGALRVFFGAGLALGNALSLAVLFIPVTWAFRHRMRHEEQVLADNFPEDYPAYARETKRLIPFLW